MRATTSNVLYGEYAAPEPAFVDLENVLLYNVGSGCYSHLTHEGIVCRRTVSDDCLHAIKYAGMERSAPIMPDALVIASGQLASMPTGSNPAHWWACLRERLEAHAREPIVGESASLWRQARLGGAA
jgi:hypothetical protein